MRRPAGGYWDRHNSQMAHILASPGPADSSCVAKPWICTFQCHFLNIRIGSFESIVLD